ncbi:MAG: hypothetical protein ACM3S4_09685 [Burkholderiales bacterium]
MKGIRIVAALVFVMAMAAIVCGCTVSNGVFIGMAQSSTDKSLSVSYISFDGSIEKRVPLKAGDEVKFSIEGEGLVAAVIKDGKQMFSITDGGIFNAPEEGTYAFRLSGKAKDGSCKLAWEIT